MIPLPATFGHVPHGANCSERPRHHSTHREVWLSTTFKNVDYKCLALNGPHPKMGHQCSAPVIFSLHTLHCQHLSTLSNHHHPCLVRIPARWWPCVLWQRPGDMLGGLPSHLETFMPRLGPFVGCELAGHTALTFVSNLVSRDFGRRC